MTDILENLESHEEQWLLDGFTPWQFAGPFVPTFSRVFYKDDGKCLTFRSSVLPIHCNGRRVAHGGFLATMADVWLGYNVAHALPSEAQFSTCALNMNYVKPVPAGRWIESAIDRVRVGARLCFASGAILCNGKPAAFMSGEFTLLTP